MARLEEFDDVQLDVEFTQAGTRSNLTSNENIAISFGKIAKWYEALVPTGGSSGQFLGFNSSGTAKWVSNPNTDQNVKATKLAQSTAEASYYPTLVAGEGTAGVSIIDSAKINHSPGTTSIVGNTRLILGNGINEGTTNNEAGLLRIYSSGTKYHTLKGAKITTDNVDHTLPTIGGTILNTGTTSFTQTLSSGTKIGTIKINGTSSDIYATTVNDAALTLKGAGTTVTTFTANASSAKSLDIVAGSNVTVTADATNAKISIAASHPTITKSTDTTSTVSPAHGGTFTVVDSITREANGHVTKINTKTVTLPADSNTDTKVTQSQTTTTNYRPILFGAKDSTDISTLANTVTDQAYTSTKMFAKPETGYLYASGFSTSSYINGTGAQLAQYGLYLRSYKSASLPAGGNYSYAEYAIRVYDGKAADNNGMLLTIDGGGLTIVGGGESAKSLAALISDDQRDSNTSRTRLDVGGTLNTAYHGSEEQLILSSDNNIYFLTTCQTIANRKPVVLDVNSYFYPGTTKTGSIGTSSYMWNSVYAATIYENGTSLASKYAAIGHTHGLIHSNLNQIAANGTTGGWSVIGIDPAVAAFVLKSIRINQTSPNWLCGDYGAGIAFGGADTKGVISMKYQSPVITFAGGSHSSSKTEPTWYLKITGTSGSTYNFDNFYDSTISRTANTVLAAPNGSNGTASFRSLVAADIPTLNYIGAKSDGSYYGMTNPAGADNVWIRTTSLGIIPYQSGNAGSGHGSLGTSSWYFSYAYIDNIYGSLNGNATTATKATQDGDGNTISSTYLKLSGGIMTGTLTAKASQYADEYSGALNMNNSNIYGVNAIYTADVADNASEGIHFYRDATHVDTLWMNGGSLLFVPNRELGVSTTAANSQKVARFTANPTTGQVVVTDGTTGGIKSSGYTIATSVPSGALFTDQKVRQSATTTEDFRPILMGATHVSGSSTGLDATVTDEAYVSTKLYCQPNTGNLYVVGDIKRANNTLSLWSGNDCAGVSQRNNYDINTWYGFSVSNACTNVGTLNKVAFSVNARNGQAWHTGNVHLYSASGDSPALVFQRGTFVDNLNDWKIYVSGGELRFAQSTANASSETWTTKMHFHSSDGNLYVGSTKVSLEGHTHNYAGSSSAGGAATSANILNKNNAAGATTTGVQYANGQLTVGTADGNAVEGSNGSYKLWSYPAGGTAVGGGTANIQNLRLYWSSTYFRDIFISPNNYDIYHRSVAAGTAQPWRKILDSGNYTSYALPRNIKHIHTASGTEGSTGWVKIARITVTADYPNHPMTFTIAQRGVMQYRIHLVLKNYSVASAAISEFIIARDNSWTDTNNNPRAYIIKPSDGIFDLYIRKTEGYDHIFVVDFTKADGSEGDNYSVAWTNVHAADSEITGGTEAVKKLYLSTSGGTMTGELKQQLQLRVYHGNYGAILRSDGCDTYFLVTDSGSAASGSWNSLRPFAFSNSTGLVSMGNGAKISSSSYGALSIIRTNANNAGIKFYNDSSTYLGSLALGTANGRFVRFKTDESTSYTIIDTSLLNVTESTNLGLDGGTNAFGYVSGLTKAAWNFQQTDGTIIRQFYNANWKSEIYMDYRTGQMSTRGKNNGTWQDWRIHLDSGNFSSYAVPIKTGGGIAECSGNGEYLYYTIATITISGAYVNKPILFEISGRGHHFTRLEVEFASSSGTDPGLDTNGFVTDGYHGFWIKKTATSTWVVYGKYTETRGNAVLHRITGCGTSAVTVTVNMTNYGNSLPDGCTQVTYGWMAILADRALRADKASKLSTSSAIGSDTQPVYFDSDGYPTACYPMSRTSTIYDNSSGTSTIISDLTIPADTKYFKIFIFDFNTSGSHYVTNVIDIGVDDGYYGGVISGSSQSQSFPCVITVVQLIVATTSNNRKQISIGRSNSWTIGTSPSSSTHTLYIRKIIACT